MAFADDSRNRKPSIGAMGPLVAIGGFIIESDCVRDISQQLEETCKYFGFPHREEFKWSPGRDLWMHDNLKGKKRSHFFLEVLSLLSQAEAKVFVCVNDSQYKTATGAINHELDATILFLERVEQFLERCKSHGILIVDRPSGDRKAEDAFLIDCLKTIEEGTDYVTPKNFAHNVLSTPSKFSRLLQCADLLTGCTTARVGGESTYSPELFEQIKPLFHKGYQETAGYGLKIHPEYKCDNLYHWLLGEERKWHGNYCVSYPLQNKLYCENPYCA